MTPRSLQLTGADGHALHLLSWSDAGVPLLLLHGFGNDAHVWDDFAPAVAPYYRTLALDQRGHGDSAHDPELRYDHDSMARDAIAALDALGIERVVLVGHSMGGRVSMRFARRHPERLAGLVIVDAGPELDARGVLRIRLDAEANIDPSFGSVEEYERVLARAYPLARPEVVARLARHGLRPRADGRLVPKTDPAFARTGGRFRPRRPRVAAPRRRRSCGRRCAARRARPSWCAAPRATCSRRRPRTAWPTRPCPAAASPWFRARDTR